MQRITEMQTCLGMECHDVVISIHSSEKKRQYKAVVNKKLIDSIILPT